MKKILMVAMSFLAVFAQTAKLQSAAGQKKGKKDQLAYAKRLSFMTDEKKDDLSDRVKRFSKLDDKQKKAALFDAVNFNGFLTVKALLYAGAAVESTDIWHNTPLHIAVLNGNIKIMKILLAAGAIVRPDDLRIAKNNRQVEIEKVLRVKQLFDAIKSNDTASFETLISLLTPGVAVNVTDQDNQTPLYGAVRTGNIAVVRSLLDKGASVDILDNNGVTPLHEAVHTGNTEVVKSLLDKGASVDVPDKNRCTSLHTAVDMGNTDLVNILVAKGASPDVRDNNGMTVLDRAVSNGNVEIAALLRGRKLFDAILEGDITAFNDLLIADIDLDFKYSDDLTPLALAEKLNRVEMVRLIKQKQLFDAIQKNDTTAFNDLITAGADIQSRDLRGLTPLHVAAQAGNQEATQALIAAGADIYATDRFGNTPFSSAVYSAVPDRSYRATFDKIPEKYRNIIQALVDAEFTQAKEKNNEVLVNQLLEGKKCFGGVCIKPSDGVRVKPTDKVMQVSRVRYADV